MVYTRVVRNQYYLIFSGRLSIAPVSVMFPATVCSKYSRISKQALRSRQLTPQTPTSPRAASRRVSHKFCCPAANILPRQAEMTFSYSSPTFTQTLLGGDAGRGSPRSPRLSFRASVHACKELDDVNQSMSLRSCLTGSHIPLSAVY